MRKRTHGIVALLALALVLAAAPATALIICEDCRPSDPPGTRCFGTCDGQRIFYCGDWLAMGCPTWLATEEPRSAEEAEEAFIRSLRLEPVEAPAE